jgi:DNA-binding winged helix-turn-helix (wHTH) protein/TolB-like protein
MAWLFDEYRFDPSDGSLEHAQAGQSVTLRPQVGRLLEAFLQQPGIVLDRESLCRAVWDENTVVDFESGLAALIRELRQALERVGGSASLIETVPRRGYRLLGQHVERDERPAPVSQSHRRYPRRFRAPALVLAILLAMTLGFGGWWWFNQASSSHDGEVSQPTLAIIPFDVIGPEGQEPELDRRLQLLVSDRLLAGLWQARLEGLVLIGRAALRPYEGRDDLAAAVAQDLGVDLLLEGTLTAIDGQLWRVDSRLLSMPSGRVLWSASSDWDMAPGGSHPDPVETLLTSLGDAWPQLLRDPGLGGVAE